MSCRTPELTKALGGVRGPEAPRKCILYLARKLRGSGVPCSWLRARDIWPGWFYSKKPSRNDRALVRKAIIRVAYHGGFTALTWEMLEFEEDLVRLCRLLVGELLDHRKLFTPRGAKVGKGLRDPPVDKRLPLEVQIEEMDWEKSLHESSSSLKRTNAIRQDPVAIPRYVPPHLRVVKKTEGRMCPTCRSPWAHHPGKPNYMYHETPAERSQKSSYAKLWFDAECGRYNGDALKALWPNATTHQCSRAEERYMRAHPLICKCDTGNLAARRPNMKLNFASMGI